MGGRRARQSTYHAEEDASLAAHALHHARDGRVCRRLARPAGRDGRKTGRHREEREHACTGMSAGSSLRQEGGGEGWCERIDVRRPEWEALLNDHIAPQALLAAQQAGLVLAAQVWLAAQGWQRRAGSAGRASDVRLATRVRCRRAGHVLTFASNCCRFSVFAAV